MTMRDARKLFRLFKFLVEIKKMENILKSSAKSSDDFSLFLKMGARIGFFGYWIFDNLLILSKLKLIKKPPK